METVKQANILFGINGSKFGHGAIKTGGIEATSMPSNPRPEIERTHNVIETGNEINCSGTYVSAALNQLLCTHIFSELRLGRMRKVNLKLARHCGDRHFLFII